jgi:hypothetical protein
MSTRETGIESCKERPSCGAAVLDRRRHRRWHAFVLGSEGSAGQPENLPGADDDEPEAEAGEEALEGGHSGSPFVSASRQNRS